MFASRIWCLFLGVLSAWAAFVDNPQRRDALGPLGVTLDFDFAINYPLPIPPRGQKQVPRNFVYSSHIVLNNPVSRLTDGQLWQIAKDAHNEVFDDMRQYDLQRNTKNTPLAMSILAWDNEIILASSQKGQNSFSYGVANTPVWQALERCQIVSQREGPNGINRPHKNDGKCGEEMASHLYYLFNQGRPLGERGAVVGTVLGGSPGDDKPQATNPCGIEGEVGSR